MVVTTTAATAAVTTAAQAAPSGLIGTAMMYIFALAYAAGIGLLLAAACGYKFWTWYQNRDKKSSVKKRRREA